LARVDGCSSWTTIPSIASWRSSGSARAGFAVDTADTAETALRMASNAAPHAILSDIRMPGMDGFQFRQAVLHDARLARIPVLLFSTEVADEKARRGEEVDRYCVVRSPDLREAIAALVAALVDAPAD